VKYLTAILSGIILILCLMLAVSFQNTSNYKHELTSLNGLNAITTQQLVVEQTVHKNMIRLLEDKSAESIILKDQITALKSRPDQIKYVVRTETNLKAAPTITIKEIPNSYVFRLSNGLGVAAIENKQDHYDLKTYDLLFKGQAVITEKKTSASILVSSSEDPAKWIEVPVSLTTIDTQKHVFFEPHIGIGIAASYPLNVSGALWSTFIHFPNGLDLAGATILANDHSFSAGIIPVAYNIGKPLPVLTNIWIAPAIGVDLAGVPSGSLILGGKL
jgi:hypothetical protein